MSKRAIRIIVKKARFILFNIKLLKGFQEEVVRIAIYLKN